MKPVYWIGIAIPMVLVFVVSWIPQINGPHLWFGLPSLWVWFALTSGPLVSIILWLFERQRTRDLEKLDQS